MNNSLRHPISYSPIAFCRRYSNPPPPPLPPAHPPLPPYAPLPHLCRNPHRNPSLHTPRFHKSLLFPPCRPSPPHIPRHSVHMQGRQPARRFRAHEHNAGTRVADPPHHHGRTVPPL